MRFKITAIKFDTDGDKEQANEIEKEWIGRTFEADSPEDADARGADIISDTSGWCINSLAFTKN